MRYYSNLPTRLVNVAKRIAAGLGARGECVWPGIANDLFVAHQSIYEFAGGRTPGRRALDAGCGTGYGSCTLSYRGAETVLGVDVDPRNIRFARRAPHPKNVEFEVADCQELALPPASFDFIVCSNVLEHLPQPGRFLDTARTALAEGGELLIVVPPITSAAERAANEEIPFHVSNLTVAQWLRLFERHQFAVECFRHLYDPGLEHLDFTSPLPSEKTSTDFSFEPVDPDDLQSRPTLSAVFSLRTSS